MSASRVKQQRRKASYSLKSYVPPLFLAEGLYIFGETRLAPAGPGVGPSFETISASLQGLDTGIEYGLTISNRDGDEDVQLLIE